MTAVLNVTPCTYAMHGCYFRPLLLQRKKRAKEKEARPYGSKVKPGEGGRGGGRRDRGAGGDKGASAKSLATELSRSPHSAQMSRESSRRKDVRCCYWLLLLLLTVTLTVPVLLDLLLFFFCSFLLS